MNTLTKVLELCKEAHKYQQRFDGTPYYLHPVAVAEMMTTSEERIIALLHDVMEDTQYTFQSLQSKLLELNVPNVEGIMYSLQLLTHNKDTPYIDYVSELAKDTTATKVKLADIFHNISDLPTPRETINGSKPCFATTT